MPEPDSLASAAAAPILQSSPPAGRATVVSIAGSPRRLDARTFRRILLATDFGVASEGATHEAIALAAAVGATLVAVTVVDPRRLRVDGRPARVDQVRADREAAVANLHRVARDRGVRFEYLIWVGEPGEAILEAARAEAIDLIVVGSHGRSRVGRILIGSVSDVVVRQAAVPVLVVRPPA